ncbi:hypothetical protein DIPPA_34438 [Diplonema papillatum]|nr:hypothetical protein DIPPA_34438 [Diplonema papillatum]
MVLKDAAFEQALKAVRRKGGRDGNMKRLAAAVGDSGLRQTIEGWAEHGIREMEPAHMLASGDRFRFTDSLGQEINANQASSENLAVGKEWLFIGVAQSGVPEFSRHNVGGLCLKELASQCGATWKKTRHGYYCSLREQHWFKPSPGKLFINRHYEDLRAEFVKKKIMKAHPSCSLFIPTCAVEDVPRAVAEFMFLKKFHPTRTCFISGDRYYEVGITKYRSQMERDTIFLRGVTSKDRLPVPKKMGAFHAYDGVSKKLGDFRSIRVGVGSTFPDDPMVVYAEKERAFLKQYQFPLVHHCLYLLAGDQEVMAQEAVQRSVDKARTVMENTEASHWESNQALKDDQRKNEEEAREKEERRQEATSRLMAQHNQFVSRSALGKFMKARDS